jgi:hypothetical protein
VRSPSRLPAGLIDPATGLARTNMRVACHHVADARYACRVRVQESAASLRLQVRFRPGDDKVEFVREVPRRAV